MTFEQIAKIRPADSGRKIDQRWAEMGGDEGKLFLFDIFLYSVNLLAMSILIYFLNV